MSQRLLSAARGVLETYAQVLFLKSPWAGLCFFAATVIAPDRGAAGLLGLLVCIATARGLGLSVARSADETFFGATGLLVGLAFGLFFRPGPATYVALVLACMLGVGVALALRGIVDRTLALPILSLPFVLVTWLALLAARRFGGIEPATFSSVIPDTGMGSIYLRSLGACFWQPEPLPGALVLGGLLLASRWTAALTALGFAAGFAVYVRLGGPLDDLRYHLVGFNFVLAGVAVGGVWLLLSPTTLVLSAVAGALAAMVSAATLALLKPWALPVLAFPFIAVTWAMLHPLLHFPYARGVRPVRGRIETPEENLARVVQAQRRYPDPTVPVFFLPVMGTWRITQGHDGDRTHQGAWRHAWDFEVVGEDDRPFRGDGTALTDFHAYRAPVVAPAAGRVVRVVNHLDDNPIGEVDTVNNWGNLVLLWHAGEVYTALCHLQKESITVVEGELVTVGQPLGRVGNSGRSPLPHLHFQVQRSAEIGAPTLYGELLHYVTHEHKNQRYVTYGVPTQGQDIASVSVDAAVRQALTLSPGRRFHWHVRAGKRTFDEVWESHIDALGTRELVVVEGQPARAAIHSDERYTTVLDYRGPRHTLLGTFYLAMGRVPHLDTREVTWVDSPAVTALVAWPARILAELLMPFTSAGAVPTSTRLQRDERGFTVETALETQRVVGAGHLPDRITVAHLHGEGASRIQAFRAGKLLMEAIRCD